MTKANSNTFKSPANSVVVGIVWVVGGDGGIVGVSSWVVGVARPGDHGVETVVLVGGVVNSTDGTIGFHKGVLALYHISVTALVLGFVVSGVGIFNAIFELVFGVSLKQKGY